MATIPRGTQVRRYEIETLVGAGGMGEVYRARDVELGRTVALKILRAADERRFIQEGRAAIALNHPHIAHLYDLGEERGLRFLAMEFVEGETLRARMQRKPLTLDEAIEVAIQIASALGSAHRAGIIHRDIKPDNVMLRPDGYVKVLDFGLAKLPLRGDMNTITAAGFTVGTVEYMSPEQLRGDAVDARTDLYSLGVLLRELTGNAKPLQRVIAKATARHRDERYANADELIAALKAVRHSRPLPSWLALIPVVAVMIVFAVSVRTRQIVPAPPPPPATESLSVVTQPPGAQVFLERVRRDGSTEPRLLAGTTPLDRHALPRGDYVLTVEKRGFAPMTRTISLTATKIHGGLIAPRPIALQWALAPRAGVPEDMAPVPGGTYRLAGWQRPTHRPAELDPFLIDRFEVTNRDFAEFIRAGGYLRRELWKHPFVKDGRTLSFDEAMQLFVDTTGLNAPRHWSGQSHPRGLENHPVTHVSWYEAAAYAEFRGKSLPTVFQWNKAARDGRASPFGPVFPWGLATAGHDVLRRANFRGEGTMPADSLRSGISPYGAHHMAGNVAEWCLNAIDDGRAATGGAYDMPVYQFAAYGSYPPFYSSANLGFRCARVAGNTRGDQGAFAISVAAEAPALKPVGDAEFAKLAAFYEYEKTPLDARVLERRADDGWTVELIEFNGSGGDRARAYLLLPRNRKPPFEVIHYVPPGDVLGGIRTLEHSMALNAGPQVRGGRAAFAVLLRGYIGRKARVPFEALRPGTNAYADAMAEHVIELRRGLDYLQTRSDLDTTRLGLFAPSGGGTMAILLAGVDRRHRSTLLFGAGVRPDHAEAAAEADRVHFAPRIVGPKLMLHGRWDESIPLADAKPLFAILSEPKRMIVYDGGHITPPDLLARETRKWFDETLTGSRAPGDSRTR